MIDHLDTVLEDDMLEYLNALDFHLIFRDNVFNLLRWDGKTKPTQGTLRAQINEMILIYNLATGGSSQYVLECCWN